MEGRLIQDGIDELEARGVDEMFVLPLFVSSGSTHVDDIRQAFGLPPAAFREGELEPFRVRARVTVGLPIDDDPIIAELIADNVRELSIAPEREALLLIAHGSRERGLNRIWRDGMRKLAARVRELGGFARAETAMLLPDQAACVMRALTKRQARAGGAARGGRLLRGAGRGTGDGRGHRGAAVSVARVFHEHGDSRRAWPGSTTGTTARRCSRIRRFPGGWSGRS